MLGGAECRGKLFPWLWAKENFFVIFFYPKTAILLRSPKTMDVFNQDFIS